MHKNEKERVVEELTARLRSVETLIVSDYRGLTMTQIDDLRSKLLEHGARFTVVKNTLTRRAAEAAGFDTLLALLEGPTAIAFLDSEGDPAAVAKALADAARETRVLAIRGGILEGRAIGADEVERLSKLPPAEILRGQLVGALAGPLMMVVGLFAAPLRDLVGVIDARVRQLEEQGGEPPSTSPEAEGASGTETQGEDGAAPVAAAEGEDRTEAQGEGGAAPAADAETPAPGVETAETTTEES